MKISSILENERSSSANNIFCFGLLTAAILLIPLLLKWPWTLSDYIVMGTLIFGTGLAYELITKMMGKKHRLIIAAVLLVAFLLVWIELAVGLFGTPIAGS